MEGTVEQKVQDAFSMFPGSGNPGIDAFKQKMIETESVGDGKPVEDGNVGKPEDTGKVVVPAKGIEDMIREEADRIASLNKPVGDVRNDDVSVSEVKKDDLDGLMFIRKPSQVDVPVDIPDLKNAFSYIEKSTGVKIEKPEDFQNFVTSHKRLVEEKEALSSRVSELSNLEEVFAALPDEMFEAVKIVTEGGDYRQFLKDQLNNKIDFSKSFNKHSKEELIEFYFPGKFSKDELQEEDNKAVNFAFEQVESKYNADHAKFKTKDTSYRDAHAKQLKEYNEKLTKSYKLAEQHFATIPGVNEDNKKELAKVMSMGQEGILNLFFNDDGTWKNDSMENLSYLKYAKDNFIKLEKILEGRIRSEVNKDVVSRASDSPRKTNGEQGDASIVAAELQKEIDRIVPKQRKII